MLERIWALGLMKRWFCIWDDLANPKIGLNIIINPMIIKTLRESTEYNRVDD
jgi:hypothetical protein